MVAVCLMGRVPFAPIDSSTVLRKLENDQNAKPVERATVVFDKGFVDVLFMDVLFIFLSFS